MATVESPKRGRRPKSPEKCRRVPLSIRLTAAEYDAMASAAAAADVSLTEWIVRRCVKR